MKSARLAALGDSRDDALVLDVVRVVGLDIGGQTVERALESVFRRRVHHAGLWNEMSALLCLRQRRGCLSHACRGEDTPISHHPPSFKETHILRRIIRHPANKRNLAPTPLAALQLILDVKHRIPPSHPLFALAVLALGG